MSQLWVKTIGNASPQGKPRVYFTCHPQDVRDTLDKIVEDLLNAQDCAVCYTENMEEDAVLEDLTQMNLFVVPVTLRFLTDHSRALDRDIPFALEHHIPILPVMMEEGLDALYSGTKQFGTMQYLDRVAHGSGEITYEEKLKKYLESVLVSEEMIQRIQEAFDFYIFLSYRKKDRTYANELMRMIHRYDEYRDIAIWYDEYLVPGEKFDETIEQALHKSELFTLLVTPNLINEDNYVKNVEYPAAYSMGKPIFPVAMKDTDKEELKRQYPGIPECTDGKDDEQLRRMLTDAVSALKLQTRRKDAVHTFLIGLAYLDGIDVETDRSRGALLISEAAESGLAEAIRKLVSMYQKGTGIALDYRKAAAWQEKLLRKLSKEEGNTSEDYLLELLEYCSLLSEIGKYEQALKLLEDTYSTYEQVFGKDSTVALRVLNDISVYTNQCGDYRKALDYSIQVYEKRKELFGEQEKATIIALQKAGVN